MARTEPEQLARTITELADARGAGKTICPSEVARALAGDHPDAWGPLMQPVRRVAVQLMKEGRITILRKGRPVDPDDFKGVYRIATVPPGAGGPEEVAPASADHADERLPD